LNRRLNERLAGLRRLSKKEDMELPTQRNELQPLKAEWVPKMAGAVHALHAKPVDTGTLLMVAFADKNH